MIIVDFYDRGDDRIKGSFVPTNQEEVIFIRELRDRLSEYHADLKNAFIVVDEEGVALILSRTRRTARTLYFRHEIIDLNVEVGDITVRFYFTGEQVSILRDSTNDNAAPTEFLNRVGGKQNYAAKAEIMFDGGGFQITLALGPWEPR